MKKFVLILAVVLTGSQCDFNKIEVDNLSLERYNGLVGLPIGELDYTLRELLEEVIDSSQALTVGEDSIFTLIYVDSAFFDTGEDLLNIGDISNSGLVTLAATPAVLQATEVPINQTFTFNYQPENDEPLDSVVYQDGQVVLDLTSSLPSNVSYSFSITNTVDLSNGQPVAFSGQLGANSSVQQEQSLVNHATTLSPNGNLNTFEVNFSGTVFLSAGQSISLGDNLSFTLTYQNQTFEVVFGFFGQDNIEIGNQIVDISFFDDLGSGITFENPQINLTFTNSFGLPIGMSFGSIFSVASGNDSTFLDGSVVGAPQLIGSPTTSQVGQSVDSTLSINSGNSNLRDLLSTSPNQLGFNLTALTNPFSTDATNFLTNNSEISTAIELRLPLSVQFENLTRSLEYTYEEVNLADADSISIRFVTENQLPFRAELTLQILDADSVLLHEVPDNLVLASPFQNRNGVVSEGEVNIANVPLSPEGIEAFQNGSIFSLILTLNTPETLTSQEIFVDLLAQYTLEVKVSLVVKLDVDL